MGTKKLQTVLPHVDLDYETLQGHNFELIFKFEKKTIITVLIEVFHWTVSQVTIVPELWLLYISIFLQVVYLL